MTQIKNPLELYKYLEKTNCGLCGLPACMAFAVAVIKGDKDVDECPSVDPKAKELLGGVREKQKSYEDEQANTLEERKTQIAQIDFTEATKRLGARFKEGMLAINCLGKDFLIDKSGNMRSECHVNPWVHGPLLNYTISCKGRELTGEWVTIGELQGGPDWKNFFTKRCEEDMHKLADAHTDLFFEIVDFFSAEYVQGVTSADKSILLRPLPRVPFLINYWEPEDGIPSKLNILFDRSAQENAGPEALYALGRGMVEMFRQLIVRHNRDGKLF